MPIKSYGKKHMEDVVPELNTKDSVAHWCGVDTRIGTLTCVLEENYCFDAESYADELGLDEQIDFREDHRSMLNSMNRSREQANSLKLIWASGYCDISSLTLSTKRSRGMRSSEPTC